MDETLAPPSFENADGVSPLSSGLSRGWTSGKIANQKNSRSISRNGDSFGTGSCNAPFRSLEVHLWMSISLNGYGANLRLLREF
jgi:hypothetical protein